MPSNYHAEQCPYCEAELFEEEENGEHPKGSR